MFRASPCQAFHHIVYSYICVYYWNMHRAQYVHYLFISLLLYDLISKYWQEPNGKARDESARLQFRELEVIITLKGEERQREEKNNQHKVRRGISDSVFYEWTPRPGSNLMCILGAVKMQTYF